MVPKAINLVGDTLIGTLLGNSTTVEVVALWVEAFHWDILAPELQVFEALCQTHFRSYERVLVKMVYHLEVLKLKVAVSLHVVRGSFLHLVNVFCFYCEFHVEDR